MSSPLTLSDDEAANQAARPQRLALLAIIAGAIGIAFAPIFVRLSDVGPVASAVWRVGLATPLLFLLAAISHKRRARHTDPGPPPFQAFFIQGSALGLGFCGLSFAADLGFWHYSIEFTTVANSTLLANLAPIFVALAAWLLFKDPPNRGLVMGLALAMIGCVILMFTSLELGNRNLIGDVLGIATAMAYAAYQLSVAKLSRRFDPLTIMAWSSLITTPILVLLAVILGEQIWPSSGFGWGAVIALAVISHAGGQTCIAYGFAHLNSTFASTSLLLQPVVAALLAWVIFGEALGPLHIIGGLVVLTGIYLARRAS
ncbi:MAG: DMT family transporter [Alphaproteobacteria bacterium]|nr:DMT family transporter [Alphaproteobacteria bacterium SS10]